MTPRTATILALAAAGHTSPQIAAKLGLGPGGAATVRAALRRHGAPKRRPGSPRRDPAASPVTHHTARGRAALARLVAVAGARGVTVEGVLDALEAGLLHPTGKVGHRADGLRVEECDVIGADGRPTGARVWRSDDGQIFAE